MRSFAIHAVIDMPTNINDFITFFDTLQARQLPFVLFRLPHSDELILYQQHDNKHHQTNSLQDRGFVFAPFEATHNYTYIPDTDTKTFTVPKLKNPPEGLKQPTNNSSKPYYLDLIDAAKKAIHEKKLKKVVVSRVFEQAYSGKIAASFLKMVYAYPNAMVYYWSHPQTGDWMGASPETLLYIKDGILKTMALAGTLPYTENTLPNWTLKEIDEQQMVTDFIQTQLKTLFPSHNITPSPTYTKRAGNLVHLCADFELHIEDTNPTDVVRLLHPTPAVAGVPVDQSLAFLATNETHKRSYYAGFLGPVQSHTCKLFVNLRCAQVTKESLKLYVGGGITSESDAETEWQESQRKAETLLRVL